MAHPGFLIALMLANPLPVVSQTLPAEPRPAIVQLREDVARYAHFVSVAGSCFLVGWEPADREDPFLTTYLAKAEALGVPAPDAAAIYSEEIQRVVTSALETRSAVPYPASPDEVSAQLTALSERLAEECPKAARQFPDAMITDGDEPTNAEEVRDRLISITAD